MSAIFGLWHRDGEPAGRADVARMGDSLRRRGPDGENLWNEGPVALGNRILRTTQESLRERLPVTNAAGEVVLTADARIDNREELIAGLGLADRPAAEISDGELILAAYERWGEACPEKLLGDFAFAVWDGRRRALFCARDPLGVRPLYYYESPRLFAFASEIKALLCLNRVPQRLNEVKVADHLVPIFGDTAITFYQGILRLPAAHRLSIRRENGRLQRYWSLDPAREIRLASDGEYAEAFRDHFTAAVRCRLRGSGPVGALLSGGLDSSSIVGTAREILAGSGQQLRTYSAIFPSLREADPRIDERPYIDAVVALGEIEPHFVRADQLAPLSEILWCEGEAIPAPNLYMDQALFGVARDHGTQIVLSGWDGDTTVSHGLEYLPELARTGRWWALRRESRALAKRLPNRSLTPGRVMWKLGFRPLVPECAVGVWRTLRGRGGQDVIGTINPAFARRIGVQDRIQSLSRPGRSAPRTARRDHARGLASGVLVYGLELLDKVAAAHSLDLRHPFCDRRLVEFCLALPPEQKLHDGWSRAVMRRAMGAVLPREVRARAGKGNLSANFKRRFLDEGRETLEGIMRGGSELVGEYVDMGALRAAYHRYASQPLVRERDALAVFLGATLALWFRHARLASSP